MSRATVLAGPWRTLAEACGGVAALARELGVAPSTVHRWGTDRVVIGRPSRLMVAALARRKRVESPVDATPPASSDRRADR